MTGDYGGRITVFAEKHGNLGMALEVYDSEGNLGDSFPMFSCAGNSFNILRTAYDFAKSFKERGFEFRFVDEVSSSDSADGMEFRYPLEYRQRNVVERAIEEKEMPSRFSYWLMSFNK